MTYTLSESEKIVGVKMKILVLFLLALLGCSVVEGSDEPDCDLSIFKEKNTIQFFFNLLGQSVIDGRNVSKCALLRIENLGEKFVINEIAKYVCQMAEKSRFTTDAVEKPINEERSLLKQRVAQLTRREPQAKKYSDIHREAHIAARKREPSVKSEAHICLKVGKTSTGHRSPSDVATTFCSNDKNTKSNVCEIPCNDRIQNDLTCLREVSTVLMSNRIQSLTHHTAQKQKKFELRVCKEQVIENINE
ncbi:uncharacterized protein [Channa argus]|uniref:uncharacterized protein n=1 Tax=Channa argus TaxID=215402 RepID=UPI003520BE02